MLMETNDKKIRNTRIIAVTALIIAVASLLLNVFIPRLTSTKVLTERLKWAIDMERQSRGELPLNPENLVPGLLPEE